MNGEAKIEISAARPPGRRHPNWHGKTVRRIVPVAAVAVIGATIGQSAATAEVSSDTTTTYSEAAEVANSIAAATPAAVSESTAKVTQLPDGTTVATTEGHGTVAVSDEGAGGVKVTSADGLSVGISAAIPDSAQGKVVDGMTVFDLGNHAVAYQPVAAKDGGGVRTLFTMESVASPTTFRVNFELPEGGRLVPGEGGSVLAVDADGQTVGSLPAPWAKDANGVSVRTSYQVRDDQLIQRVEPDANTAFPVVADPFWIPAWAVAQIIRCGAGGYLGWISSAGWRWYSRALAVAAGCLIGKR